MSNKKEMCESCKYFKESNCLRYPPQVSVIYDSERDDENTYSDFPHVMTNEWCGEFIKKDDK